MLIRRAHHYPHIGLGVGCGEWMYDYPARSRDHILHIAVKHGQYDIVAWLVSSPIATTLRRTLQYLFEDVASAAIQCGDLYVLELLLTSTVWATFPDDAQTNTLSSLLSKAIKHWCGAGEAVELVAAHGADVSRDVPGMPLYRPLIYAVDHEPTGEAVVALSRHGMCMVGEYAPLHRAVKARAHAVIAALLSVDADPRAPNPDDNTTPLFLAAERGLHETVATLLEVSCVDMDAQDEIGKTPLTGAVQRREDRHSTDCRVDHLKTVETLLEHGASTEICTTRCYDCAPLHWAVRSADVDMVRALLTRGADPNLPSAFANETPTHYAAEMIRLGAQVEEAKAMLELLVEHGADLLHEKPDGMTPYHLLCESQDGQAWLKSPAIQPQ